MKIFSKVSVKALAIVASTLMLSASIAHAQESCTTTCGNYAHGAGMLAKNQMIANAPSICASTLTQHGQAAYDYCISFITGSQADYVYTQRYNQVMAECMAVCRP